MIEGRDTSGIRTSLWFSDCQIPSFPQLKKDIKTQVCIIGGGIAGLTTAYNLCKEGKDVVLLDDGKIVSGETGRTSGHLCNALDDHFYELEKVYGKKGAHLIAQSHSTAIDTIEDIIAVESIDCDFKRVNGYLFLDPKDKISTLKKELKAATRAGLKVELLKQGNINGFKIGPCLKFYNQAKFHPLKYLSALAKAITKKKGKIFNLTHASEIKPGKIVEVITSNGCRIKANKVIIATNAPVFDKALLFAKQEANRTYVVGFKIKNKALEDALFWDTGDPYHYLRLHSIDNELILSVGGEDHRTGKEVDKKKLLTKLENWAKRKISHLGPVKYYWSGQIMEPVDHIGFIGFDPTKYKNIFVVTGDSGNGLTNGTVAAILLTDHIMGRKNPWWKIYKPSRKPTRNLVSFASHNIKGMSKYADYLTPGDITYEKKIKAGEGAVIRKGLHKIAVYKDESGKLHHCSAVCPHMGGIVSWNSLEKSWDCPLHGSRFAPLGEVMNGPANKGLEKVKKASSKKKI